MDQLVATLEKRGLRSIPPRDDPSGERVLGARLVDAPPKSRKLPLVAAGLAGAVIAVAALAFAVKTFQGRADTGGPNQAEHRAADATAGEAVTGKVNEPARDPEAVKTQAASPKEQSPPSAQPTRSSTDPMAGLDSEAAVRRQVEAVVAQGSQAEIDAFRALDPGPLMAVYDGEVLESLLLMLNDLSAAGFRALNTLHFRKIISIDVSPDGTEAEVEMVESWSSEYHNDALGTCLYVPQHHAPQTLYLYRGPGGGWKVEEVEHYGVAPDPVPC